MWLNIKMSFFLLNKGRVVLVHLVLLRIKLPATGVQAGVVTLQKQQWCRSWLDWKEFVKTKTKEKTRADNKTKFLYLFPTSSTSSTTTDRVLAQTEVEKVVETNIVL